MSGGNAVTCYMSRRLDLPPLVAQAAYDAQRLDAGLRVGSRAPRGWLDVRGRAQASNGRHYRPYRAQSGRLVAALSVWPVQLELLPWSSERTELGLRPVHRRLWREPPDCVFAVGHHVLGRLEARLREWADAPLRELVAPLASSRGPGGPGTVLPTSEERGRRPCGDR